MVLEWKAPPITSVELYKPTVLSCFLTLPPSSPALSPRSLLGTHQPGVGKWRLLSVLSKTTIFFFKLLEWVSVLAVIPNYNKHCLILKWSFSEYSWGPYLDKTISTFSGLCSFTNFPQKSGVVILFHVYAFISLSPGIPTSHSAFVSFQIKSSSKCPIALCTSASPALAPFLSFFSMNRAHPQG